MRTFNARVAIYCDVEIEVPDDFDYDNYDADDLIDKAFEKTPEPYDTNASKAFEVCGYEVISIWDEEKDLCLYAI